jgi:hypothetical protein
MVVEVDLTAEYLERTRKLMRICQKIRQTMPRRARIIIEERSLPFRLDNE